MLVAAVAVAVALSGTPASVVRVVVTTGPATKSTTAGASGRDPATSLPPASAGSNGSFPQPAASSPLLRPGARASFAHLVGGLPGPVAMAVAPVRADGVVLLGDDAPAPGWSTTKVPVLVALLLARGSSGLTPTERQEAELAITESDNQSILDLFGDLETLKGGLIGASNYIQGLFRESGDDRTVVATAPPPPGAVTTFGQTEWAPGESVKFFQALGRGCLLPPAETGYVLGLMQNIVPSESWGLGSAGFSVPVAFKGGWGPEPSGSYLVRQSGIVDPASSRAVAVSIVAHPPPGSDSFTIGTQMITETAQWFSRELRLLPRSGEACEVR